MEISVYYGSDAYNEKSEIFKISNLSYNNETKEKEMVKIENTSTTLESLYLDGWRLIQAIPRNNYGSTHFFLERG